MSHPIPPRILLVDDTNRLREAVARQLRDRGCDVETAPNGLEGLDRLAHGPFDAVVSDISMPLMDGLTFLRHALARDPSLRHRFILCSAEPLRSQDVDQAVPFLPKPFTGSELWALLERLFAARPDAPLLNGR